MIELAEVGKRYRALLTGRTVDALRDLTLRVERGEVFGIAGPNGAGKSTLISLLLGFLEPSAGTVRLGGVAPRAWVERHGAAYLTELVAIPPRWTLDAALRRYAALGGMAPSTARARVDAVIDRLGLAEHRRKQVRQLSKGNLQRLGLGQALLADSDLVILDEPTHGLDPLWTQRFRDIVEELRRPDRVVVIASHNLDELERLADRVAILHQGRLDRVVTAGGVAREAGLYRLVLAAPYEALTAIFPGALPVDGRRHAWRIAGDLPTLNRGLATLIAAGGSLAAFHPEESRLESEFRQAIGGTS